MAIATPLPTIGSAERPVSVRPAVDIVVPVHNEEDSVERSVRRLHTFLRSNMPFVWRIVIADNASTDGTLGVAHRLADELLGVEVLHLAEKGRGRALREAWLVLRHRAADPRPEAAPADPRGARRLDRRSGQPRRHRQHRP